MVSVSRRLVFLTAAALLTASGIFTLGIQAERATQTAPSSTIAAAVLKALQWRSVGPPRAGRSIAASGVKGRPKEAYFGADRRRSLEDDRRRRDVGAGDRRADQQLVGRRGRRLGVQSRHRLHRHGRVVHPRQHPAGRRRLQVDRRRQDLDARRLLGLAGDLEDPHPSDQSRHRLRRVVRQVRRAERRARHLQEHRRRQDAGRRRCSATTRPAASTSQSIRTIPTSCSRRCGRPTASSTQMSSGGPGSGLFKSTDGGETWTEITRKPGLPTTVIGKIGVAVSGADCEPRLRDRRERKRRPLQLRRRRATRGSW